MELWRWRCWLEASASLEELRLSNCLLICWLLTFWLWSC